MITEKSALEPANTQKNVSKRVVDEMTSGKYNHSP